LIEYTLFYKKPMFKITFVHYTHNVFTAYTLCRSSATRTLETVSSRRPST
jgi:hypothetical protein